MKKYQSHKIVEAAVIVMHTDGLVVVRDPDGTEHSVTVPNDFAARGEPSNGDYLVRYQPDGYLSWSPKPVFEAGYAELREAGMPAAVEVTVTAPAGKRAEVVLMHEEVGSTTWTVTGGQSQTCSVVGDEVLIVHPGEPHSTLAHKLEAS
jgi:hypothetical protein